MKKKGTLTTFFLLVGKLPFDFTIMVHSLTSSGWVHLVEKKTASSGHRQVRMSERYRLKGPVRSPTSYGVKRGHIRHGKAISRNIRAAAAVSRSVKGDRAGTPVQSALGLERVRVIRTQESRGSIGSQIVYIPFKVTCPSMRTDTGRRSGKWTRSIT